MNNWHCYRLHSVVKAACVNLQLFFYQQFYSGQKVHGSSILPIHFAHVPPLVYHIVRTVSPLSHPHSDDNPSKSQETSAILQKWAGQVYSFWRFQTKLTNMQTDVVTHEQANLAKYSPSHIHHRKMKTIEKKESNPFHQNESSSMSLMISSPIAVRINKRRSSVIRLALNRSNGEATHKPL